MNERIQELVIKADKIDIEPDDVYCESDYLGDTDPRRVELFAKMIIEECCDQIRMIDEFTIKRHFGLPLGEFKPNE
jgi:hypothetical protein